MEGAHRGQRSRSPRERRRGLGLCHRLGRAMLLPLFKRQHAHSRASKFSANSPLCLALRWWLEILKLDLRQDKKFHQGTRAPVHLFADARGHPARLAAVLLIDGEILFCDCEPPAVMMDALHSRNDNQIMGLELFSLALGLCSFSERLRNRRVFLWSDNVGAERGTASGRARTWDHACVIHSVWLFAAQLSCQLHIDRVPTSANIADAPSREDYELLNALGARKVEAQFDECFLQAGAWEALRLKNAFF